MSKIQEFNFHPGLKLDPEFKAKWLARLRDPESKQAREALRRGDEMCCLGHLCEVLDPAGWQPATDMTRAHNSRASHYYEQEKIAGIPPLSVLMKVFGQTEPEHGYTVDILALLARTLASFNDRGHTLPEIADWIEENL